eukprot:gene14305-biopygen8087
MWAARRISKEGNGRGSEGGRTRVVFLPVCVGGGGGSGVTAPSPWTLVRAWRGQHLAWVARPWRCGLGLWPLGGPVAGGRSPLPGRNAYTVYVVCLCVHTNALAFLGYLPLHFRVPCTASPLCDGGPARELNHGRDVNRWKRLRTRPGCVPGAGLHHVFPEENRSPAQDASVPSKIYRAGCVRRGTRPPLLWRQRLCGAAGAPQMLCEGRGYDHTGGPRQRPGHRAAGTIWPLDCRRERAGGWRSARPIVSFCVRAHSLGTCVGWSALRSRRRHHSPTLCGEFLRHFRNDHCPPATRRERDKYQREKRQRARIGRGPDARYHLCYLAGRGQDAGNVFTQAHRAGQVRWPHQPGRLASWPGLGSQDPGDPGSAVPQAPLPGKCGNMAGETTGTRATMIFGRSV